ncbi:DUF1801 domain-containing protein [uncultured Fluviicola sp.]|uniref:DUF1801 domain-containing protein n=1 Tax=uncultured Fluviicola sp. TaxID=463303 RepID=UPI0025D53C8A|nr:DUF1801 domain-containing protein [uncultured Fluviicola sp.]
MKQLTDYYLQQEEPVKSTLLALRDIILGQNSEITHELKYGMPFFCYKGKMFCYLWTHKKHKQPYIGFVEGKLFEEPFMLQEKRSRMKVFLVDPDGDLPVEQIGLLVQKALDFYH